MRVPRPEWPCALAAQAASASASSALEVQAWPSFDLLLTVVNMTRRSGASAKAQALAKATEAVARRDAERIEREKRLQTTLTEFFQAQGQAEHIRAAADEAAAPFDAAMRDSVRALEGIGETRAGIASLTGLPLSRVREHLADGDLAPTAQGSRTAESEPPREQRDETSSTKPDIAAAPVGRSEL
jgi:hypothetical protein